jgi:hypothetical protein
MPVSKFHAMKEILWMYSDLKADMLDLVVQTLAESKHGCHSKVIMQRSPVYLTCYLEQLLLPSKPSWCDIMENSSNCCWIERSLETFCLASVRNKPFVD